METLSYHSGKRNEYLLKLGAEIEKLSKDPLHKASGEHFDHAGRISRKVSKRVKTAIK